MNVKAMDTKKIAASIGRKCGRPASGSRQAVRVSIIVRSKWVCLALATLCKVGVSRKVHAQDVAVPLPMQVQLLATVADYDKGFVERANGKAKIVLLTSKNPDSAKAANQIQGALGKVAQIGGVPHEESIVKFESGAALASLCKANGISIVFVMPGFQSEIGDIKNNLTNLNILSVASVGSYVQQGIVLGFDVISGKPKLLVNLPQARTQKVNFKAELLKMVKVIE
jgi:hypothetical protein